MECGVVVRRGGITVFRLHGFGALGPFAIDQQLATLRVILHGESGDTVASSMNSGTTGRAMSTVLGHLRKVLHAVAKRT